MTFMNLRRKLWCLPLLAALCLLAQAGAGLAADPAHGEKIYGTVCIGCHQIGVLDAPKKGDSAAWRIRLQKGVETLVQHAMDGFGKMPAKGGNPNLKAEDIRAAIGFMAGPELIASAQDRDGKMAQAIPLALVALPEPVPAASAAANPTKAHVVDTEVARGARVVNLVCKGCHQIGVLGAPKIGNKKDWEPRLARGEEALVKSATVGLRNMPPKGGMADLSSEDLLAAIRYMANPPAIPITKLAAAPSAPSASPSAPAKQSPTDVNRFNRLMRSLKERNLPPAEDGIHDPANDGTAILQPPKLAFEPLPKSSSGNYVDWVQALQKGAIEPRWDLNDPTKEPLVMDLNIVREVKGSMPNVVYPHKQHLQWLDCSNCHPAIFIPQKGANQISMAEIILGRKCGVCHGKVAFPVAECRRCHSQKKAVIAEK